MSVLTDQVEAQGEKIRDLDLCLDEHREKLNTTEEMLQQVGVFFLCKSSLIACCLLKKEVLFYFLSYFYIPGAFVQSCTGDPEAWTDVWTDQPEAEIK